MSDDDKVTEFPAPQEEKVRVEVKARPSQVSHVVATIIQLSPEFQDGMLIAAAVEEVVFRMIAGDDATEADVNALRDAVRGPKKEIADHVIRELREKSGG